MPVARFTVLSDECVRIEWSSDDPGRFVDEPSLFSPRRPLPRRVVIADAAAGAPPVDIRTPRDAISHGIGLVPEDRKLQALFLSQAIRTNMSVAALDRAAAGMDVLTKQQADAIAADAENLTV